MTDDEKQTVAAINALMSGKEPSAEADDKKEEGDKKDKNNDDNKSKEK